MTTDQQSLHEIAERANELAELRDATRGVLARAWSPSRLRALLDDEPAFDTALWETVRSLGWCDVLVPAGTGGGGASPAELCVVAEEAGAAAAPVPLGAAAVAGWCEERCADGMTLLLTEVEGRSDPGAPGTVSGSWPLVPYGAVADRFALLARGAGEAPSLVAVDAEQDGVERTLLRPLDRGPAAAVHLTEVPVDAVVAEGNEAVARWAQAKRLATLASVAELVGVAAAANEAACEYAKVRVAFDRPIGTFQAIKHRLVDQRAAIEVARALTARAADACQRHHPDADPLTSLAAFWAIDTLRTVPEGAVQVFGGIAYTWEHDAHVHLRRAACIAATLGSRAVHRERVVRWLNEVHTS